MDTIELVTTSLEEAKEKAASHFGVKAEDVKIEVIDETKGLFGKPGKLTVRASAKPVKAKPAKAEPAKAAAPKEEPAPEKPAKAEKPVRKAAKAVVEVAPATEEAPATEAEPKREKRAERPDVTATDEDAQNLLGLLNQLLEASGLDANAAITQLNGKYVHIEIDGKDVGHLVGRRGEVLNALQYLLNVIASRQLDNGVRVTLEGDNYRERRAQYLTDIATKLAEEVRSRGDEAVLDALPAFERRIIHQVVMEMEGVMTYSEGEEPNRRIVIAPAG